MRWEALFTDMELQLGAAAARDRADEVAELTRSERSSVGLADRFRAQGDRPVEVVLRGGERLRGVVGQVAAGWVVLLDDGREHLVPLTAMVAVAEVVGAAGPPALVARRLGLGHALRAVARDRAAVRVHVDGTTVIGRVGAVGSDHLDVELVQEAGRPTGRTLAVPFSALVRLSSR